MVGTAWVVEMEQEQQVQEYQEQDQQVQEYQEEHEVHLAKGSTCRVLANLPVIGWITQVSGEEGREVGRLLLLASG